jgi:SSS family solute:Na+ symporter
MPAWLKGALALGLISALCGSADTVLLSASGIVERSLLAGDRTNAVRFFVGVFGFAAAAAVYVSKDIIWLLSSSA